MDAVAISGLSFKYPGTEDAILEDITLNIETGEFVCVLGQSGCGKSTLLRLLAGLEIPSSGSIQIDDQSVTAGNLDTGVVFQDYGLFPWLTAGENIMLALEQKYPSLKKSERKQKALDMLARVDLPQSVFNKLPKELSGGMQQRCAIAQTLSIQPSMLLMDEPFGALDAITRARLQDLVREIRVSQTVDPPTVVFVTHDVDEALLLASRIIVLGQKPSHIIYDMDMHGKEFNRESLYGSKRAVEARTTLVNTINDNVSERL